MQNKRKERMIKIEITILPKDYIITTSDSYDNTYFSDFMLRALRIKNTTDAVIEIQDISFTVKKNGQVIKEYVYSYEALKFWIPEWNKNIHISESQIGALIGVKKLWDYNSLVESTRLEPGKEIGLRNEYFHIVYNELLDELIVQVKYTQAGTEYKESKNITLLKYENKNRYIFPVKGSWQVNGNFDCIMAHRQRNSDEFAFDLAKLDRNDMTPINKDMKPEEYPCYGEKVYAIADGLVVQVYEDMNVNTIGISKKEGEKLESIHGYWPIITGNVVSIQHDRGEYSQVDHLQYHSINLKVGERVKQGQIIGLVGDTGLSNCPHLHFELTNGFNAEARSFPCFFTNIYTNGNPIEIITEEYTMVHAE
ncbi:MAG: M23 family metallopeptidase [Clostridium sp.]|uniref:M23 family metallopeptidase n=1 Tax=Clostridium sp. TaxID=1506 RepID=UPI003D6C962C